MLEISDFRVWSVVGKVHRSAVHLAVALSKPVHFDLLPTEARDRTMYQRRAAEIHSADEPPHDVIAPCTTPLRAHRRTELDVAMHILEIELAQAQRSADVPWSRVERGVAREHRFLELEPTGVRAEIALVLAVAL